MPCGRRHDRVVDRRVDLIVVGDGLPRNASPDAADVYDLGEVQLIRHTASVRTAEDQVEVAVVVDVVVSFVEAFDIVVGRAVFGEVDHVKPRLLNRACAKERGQKRCRGNESGAPKPSVESGALHDRRGYLGRVLVSTKPGVAGRFKKCETLCVFRVFVVDSSEPTYNGVSQG